MSVKIFLPSYLFYIKQDCDIYGEIQINENNSVSYYIAAHITYGNDGTIPGSGNANSETITTAFPINHLRLLGHILRSSPLSARQQQRDVAVSFTYDTETPNIYLHNLSIKPITCCEEGATQALIFLYDVPKMLQLSEYNNNNNTSDKHATEMESNDISVLCRLLSQNRQRRRHEESKWRKDQSFFKYLAILLLFLPSMVTQAFIILFEGRALELLRLRKTCLYEHYLKWRKYRESDKRRLNIAVDKILGIVVMLLLLLYISDPGDYLMTASHFVIQKLRLLLRSLKGSPVGLKLNEHLNNFLLDCFNYHIDLWAKFLDLIEPIVRQIFVPIALLGLIGLSFQLASLPILVSIIGLHAHCFYIYTAVLYKVEIKGIQVLWKVMLGKRYNVLKNRVESHNYVNRQLYLGTIFFTSLIFLFPTVLVYYVVFTMLRLIIYIVNLLIEVLRRQILEFPLQALFKWTVGRFYDIESIYIAHTPHAPSPLLQSEFTRICMSVFQLHIQNSPLSRAFSCERVVLQEFKIDETMSIKNVVCRMLKGTF